MKVKTLQDLKAGKFKPNTRYCERKCDGKFYGKFKVRVYEEAVYSYYHLYVEAGSWTEEKRDELYKLGPFNNHDFMDKCIKNSENC